MGGRIARRVPFGVFVTSLEVRESGLSGGARRELRKPVPLGRNGELEWPGPGAWHPPWEGEVRAEVAEEKTEIFGR